MWEALRHFLISWADEMWSDNRMMAAHKYNFDMHFRTDRQADNPEV